MLFLYLVLFLVSFLKKKKQVSNEEIEVIKKEELKENDINQPVENEKKLEQPLYRYEYQSTSNDNNKYKKNRTEVSISAYVKKFGEGMILEINNNRIRDMRSYTYYRIEDNYVYHESGGLMYEISNNRIKSIRGSQLYEISGDNINKVFGGYFASISGNIISKYDNSEKYELTSLLPKKYILVVCVLLFGE